MKFIMTAAFLTMASLSFAESITLVQDARRVDGNLTELTLNRPGRRADFDATLHTAYIDRRAGKEVNTTESIGTHMQCDLNLESSTVNEINCQVDQRPVDGALVKITIVRNKSNSLYSAKVQKQHFDRANGKDVTEKNLLGSSFSLKKSK